MGTIPNSGRMAAFTGQIHPNGLDLGRSVINSALGMWQADEATSFLAGHVVMLNSDNKVVVSDGTKALGFSKWNKTSTLWGRVVDEAIVLSGTTAANLRFANVSHVKVSAAPGGAALTVTTDYTVNTTNGTITRVSGGAIGDGDTVYVSYTYQLLESHLYFQGRNFWNFLNEVDIHDGFVTVITDAELLFTSQYDSSVQYTVGAAVYASGTQAGQTKGEITATSTGALKIGEVVQVPTAGDIYLGLRMRKGSLV